MVIPVEEWQRSLAQYDEGRIPKLYYLRHSKYPAPNSNVLVAVRVAGGVADTIAIDVPMAT